MLVNWTVPGAVDVSGLWCFTVSILHSMMLPMPDSSLTDMAWATAGARDYSKQADMDEDSSLGSEQKEKI